MKKYSFRWILGLLCVFAFISCAEKPTLTAEQILSKSIEATGGKKFYNSTIRFEADNLHYTLERKNHITNFTAERLKENDSMKAVYNNGQISYYLNGVYQEPGTYSQRILNTKVDGFVYAFSLPFVLDQNAVRLSRDPDVTIRRQNYHVLHATFAKTEDGHDDEFYLYIHPETFLVEFYAMRYYYAGGKNLFRRLYNSRMVDGLRFADYYSFTATESDIPLGDLYKYYSVPQLREVQHVQYTNIEVTYIQAE